MSFKSRCKSCGQVFKLSSKKHNTRIRCPKCKTETLVIDPKQVEPTSAHVEEKTNTPADFCVDFSTAAIVKAIVLLLIGGGFGGFLLQRGVSILIKAQSNSYFQSRVTGAYASIAFGLLVVLVVGFWIWNTQLKWEFSNGEFRQIFPLKAKSWRLKDLSFVCFFNAMTHSEYADSEKGDVARIGFTSGDEVEVSLGRDQKRALVSGLEAAGMRRFLRTRPAPDALAFWNLGGINYAFVTSTLPMLGVGIGVYLGLSKSFWWLFIVSLLLLLAVIIVVIRTVPMSISFRDTVEARYLLNQVEMTWADLERVEIVRRRAGKGRHVLLLKIESREGKKIDWLTLPLGDKVLGLQAMIRQRCGENVWHGDLTR